VTDRDRKKTRKTRGDNASAIREQRYVSEQMETKYLKFLLLIILRSGGI
jgi:hypothetical protein